MKKINSIIILSLVLMLTLTSVAYGIYVPNIEIYINGVIIDSDVKPFIDTSNRTQVPIRFIAEGLGCKVDWDGVHRVVTVTKGSKVIKLTIGKEEALVNGKVVKMDTQAVIKDDRTMVPLRFIAENFDCQVEFVPVSTMYYMYYKILITTNDPTVPKVEEITFSKKFRNNKLNYYMHFDTRFPSQVTEAKNVLKTLIKDSDILSDLFAQIDKKVGNIDCNSDKEYYTYINGEKYIVSIAIGPEPLIRVWLTHESNILIFN